MEQHTCPQCGAVVDLLSVGQLKDKVLRCPYCHFTEDVPDEYEVSRVEEQTDSPGHFRRVGITERRRDLGSRAGQSTDQRTVSMDPQEVIRRLREEGKLPSAGTALDSGTRGSVLRSSVKVDGGIHVQVTGSDGKTVSQIPPEVLARLREHMGEGADAFLAGKTAGGGSGEERVFTRSVVEQRSFDDSMSSLLAGRGGTGTSGVQQWVQLIKWLVILALVVGAVVVAMRVL